MPFDGSGNYSRTNGTNTGSTTWASDAAAGTAILSSRHDTHDQDIATALSNCLCKDGQSTPSANLPMGGYKLTGMGAGSAATDSITLGQVQAGAVRWGGTSGGSATAHTISLSPAIAAYAAGQRFSFIVGATNTTTNPTLNINSLGAITIKQSNSAALFLGQLVSGSIVTVTYNGTDFLLDQPATNNYDGWTPVNEAWTYASATTITVPTDATTKYAVGDRIKLTQTTVKYFVIVGVASTTLTITGGTSYTLVNAAISANYYSHSASPVGFPSFFSYTPTLTGFSADPSFVANFSVTGRICSMNFTSYASGTSNATGFTVTAPITSATWANGRWGAVPSQAVDGGNVVHNSSASIGSASSSIALFLAGSTTGWTNSGGKGANFSLTYHI